MWLASNLFSLVGENIIELFLVLPLNNLCACPTESNLYPFGAEVGDKGVKVDTEDGNSPYITPPMGFPFMGKSYDRLYVSF